MHLLAFGISYRTAPVAVRERFALANDALPEALERLAACPGVLESAVLSTCNRTEVYAVTSEFASGRAAATGWLAGLAGWQPQQLARYVYVQVGPGDVAQHLFRVAAGLDALVLGETQVLGQVKDAYRIACERETVGKLLHALFHRALEAARRAHTETSISRRAMSVGAAAVQLARRTLGDLGRRQAVLVGAGDTAELVARQLCETGLGRLLVVNRTPERAEAVAARYGGEVRPFAELESVLGQADIVLTSTSAPSYVIDAELLARVMRRRPDRPVLVVDIAVPRDVEPAAAGLPGVVLHNIDDLEDTVAANQRERVRAARRAERIIAVEADRFAAWVQALDVVPVIRALRSRADAIRQAELTRALARLGELDEHQRAVVEALAASLVNKLLDGPSRRLKVLAAGPQGRPAAQALVDLFDLPTAPAARPAMPSPAVPDVLPPAAAQNRIS